MNHYAVLGIGPQATPAEVRTAYRTKARETHPDQGGDSDRFDEVRAAWEVLRDASRRSQFDVDLTDMLRRIGAVLCPSCGKANRVPPDQVMRCGLCGVSLPTRERTARDAVGKVAGRVRERAVAVADLLTDRMVAVGEHAVDELGELLFDGVDRGLETLRRKLGLGRERGR